MTLTTPAGTPASLNSLVMYRAVSGVSSDGLITTQQPVARAGAIFHENMYRGWRVSRGVGGGGGGGDVSSRVSSHLQSSRG
jgi:hypothetical protein